MPELLPDLYDVKTQTRWLMAGQHNEVWAAYGREGGWWTDLRSWEDVPHLHAGDETGPGRHAPYLRTVTRRKYAAPLVVRYVFEWHRDLDPRGPGYRGIHLYLGHLDNSTNYALGIRLDNALAIVQQYQGTYTRLSEYVPFQLRAGVRYIVEAVWGNRLQMRVHEPEETVPGKSKTTTVIETEHAVANARFPRLPLGQVGLRTDEQDIRWLGFNVEHPQLA